jgi:hypothetical protein
MQTDIANSVQGRQRYIGQFDEEGAVPDPGVNHAAELGST